MQIHVIPTLSDNYSYLLVEQGEALAIDPGEAAPVAAAIRAADVTLRSVLLTHRHGDHTGGCGALRSAYSCAIVGPAECEAVGLNRVVGEGDAVPFGSQSIRVMSIPGHTQGHVAYVCEAAPAVWTGDTLFVAGCGRILEGSAAMMWRSLQRLRVLSEDTAVYCGHDYTEDNLEFAASLLPDEAAIRGRLTEAKRLAKSGRPTVPSTIGLERQTNLFLRADDASVGRAVGLSGASAVAVFAELRKRKDAW